MTATPDLSDLSLMGLFRLEVETQVNELNEHLLKLEKASWEDAPQQASSNSRQNSNDDLSVKNLVKNPHYRQSLDALMRAAHSIKGAARIVQVEPAVKVAHALEDCFIAAQQGILILTANHVDVLLSGTDLLSRLGSLEESALAEQLPAHEADADAIVLTIETLVSMAERASIPSESIPSAASQSADLPLNTDFFACALPSPQTASTPTLNLEVIEKRETPAELPAEDSVRMIRISADHLNRLMGLAGESLVEANWLQPFAQSLLQLKRQQQKVIAQLEKQQQCIEAEGGQASRSLTEVMPEMQRCHTLLNDRLNDFDLFSQRLGQLSERLHREVIASHMCAFGEGSRGYERLVRDLARTLGKQVSLEITGLNTQVDRDILAKLDTPITHLLTNAVVHGIELPEVRLAQGKPAQGKIHLWAAHRSGLLTIAVEDDGAGIDYIKLRHKIADRGLTTADIAAQLSDFELSEFLFLPGFSTASQVDKFAGRGYGLDLVRTMAQSVRGSLQAISPAIENRETGVASGTRFQFQLPLTLSVVRSLLFEVAGELYAISLSHIARVIKLSYEQIRTSENRPYFSLTDHETSRKRGQDRQNRRASKSEGENVSLVLSHQVLALEASIHHHNSQSAAQRETLSVIVIGEPGSRYGLCVDRLLEEQDLVVRPLDPRLGKVPNISAVALSEQGTPILLLDVADVLRSAEKAATGAVAWASSPAMQTHSIPLAQQSLKAASADLQPSSPASGTDFSGTDLSGQTGEKYVLVVDDSMTVRAMEKKLLQNRGYKVDVAVDGAEGWNAVRMNTYDLVITDVDMPRMSGIELIGKMRAHEATQNLPVIVVSYKDRAEDQLAGLHAGANYYLTKSSFHDDGLINAVVDLIGVSRHD
jgi:two-component system, chemotaxis family, sensor histidine kinase and response regulator WspE